MTEINTDIIESDPVEVKASYVAPSLVRMGSMKEKTEFGIFRGNDSSTGS